MDERCKGVTKKGTQCRITRNLMNGYCPLHINQAESSHETITKKVKTDNVPDADKQRKQELPSGEIKTVDQEVESADATFEQLPHFIRSSRQTAGLTLILSLILVVAGAISLAFTRRK